MSKEEKFLTAEQGAFMTRLTLSSFRTKVSKLCIKGQRQGQKVFYTRKQLEDVYNGVSANRQPGRKPIKKKVAKNATTTNRVTKKRVKKVAKRRA